MTTRKDIGMSLESFISTGRIDVYNSDALGDHVKNTVYIEDAAKWLIEKKYIELIKKERSNVQYRKKYRKKSYNAEHTKEENDHAIQSFGQRLTEDRMARYFFMHKLPYIGEVFDFQTPIKNQQNDPDAKTKIGKVDLMSDDGKRVFLLELKRSGDSRHSLLHAAIEACIYRSLIYERKLLNDFSKKGREVIPCVLIFEKNDEHGSNNIAGKQFRELSGAMNGSLPKLGEILNQFYDEFELEIVILGHGIFDLLKENKTNNRPLPPLQRTPLKSSLRIPLIKIHL